MDRKAAIGLSVNMLVVIIISLVVLGGGIALVYQFVGGANEIKSQLDLRTEQELERLLVDQGKKVALPLHTATVQGGGEHVFGLGILNIGTVDDNMFTVEVTLSKAVDDKGITIPDIDNSAIVNEWVLYNEDEIKIDEHEHHFESILVAVPTTAQKGKYIFNAKVSGMQSSVDEKYGTTQKFIVTVE
jgi:hypothetical protein